MNLVCIVQLVSGMWLALLCQIMGHIIKTSKPSKYNSFSSNSYTILIVFQLLGVDSQFFTIRPEILSCKVCTVLVYIYNWYVFIYSPLKLYLENIINLKLPNTIDTYSQYVPISARILEPYWKIWVYNLVWNKIDSFYCAYWRHLIQAESCSEVWLYKFLIGSFLILCLFHRVIMLRYPFSLMTYLVKGYLPLE